MAPTVIGELPALAEARDAIARVRAAGAQLAHAVAQESELQRRRPLEKSAAIRRLMDDPAGNPLTGKAHSASSAESVVERDPAYDRFLKQCSEATIAVILARSVLDAARLDAQLALLAFGSAGDVAEG